MRGAGKVGHNIKGNYLTGKPRPLGRKASQNAIFIGKPNVCVEESWQSSGPRRFPEGLFTKAILSLKT